MRETTLALPATLMNGCTTRSVSGGYAINLFATKVDTAYGPRIVMRHTPGLELLFELEGGPVVACVEMGLYLYLVTLTRLYKVNPVYEVEDVTGGSDLELQGPHVSIATNGVHIVFVDGTKGYYYSEAEGLSEFSGDGWYPANTVTFMDGYFVFNRKGSGQFFITSLYNVALDPLDYATAEGSPDNTKAVISDGRSLFLFGSETTEIWYNNGDPDFTFARVSGALIDIGIGSPHTAVKLDNSIFWYGNEGSVYMTNGYQRTRISGEDVEQYIKSCEPGVDDDAYAYGYVDAGHAFYVLTFPEKNITVVYDKTTGWWHLRSSWEVGRHISKFAVKYRDTFVVGDSRNGKVYSMSMSNYRDNDGPVRRVMAMNIIRSATERGNSMYGLQLHIEPSPELVRAIEDYSAGQFQLLESSGIMLTNMEANMLLEGDTGMVTYDTHIEPMIMMSYSDDGGKTWSKDFLRGIGKVGEYDKVIKWMRLGKFRRRQIRFVITDEIPVTITEVKAEVM